MEMAPSGPGQKDVHKMRFTGPYRQSVAWMALLVLALTGCTRVRTTIPAQCVTPKYFDGPRSAREPVNFLQLRQDPPTSYLLGPRDILGVYIEGVLGRAEDAPPVHFSDQPNVPPSIGFPIPIREDGTLSLPLIPPINVSGLTLAQAEHEIRKAYTIDNRILAPDRARIIVTIMKPRTYSILVVREDTQIVAGGTAPSRRAEGFEPERRAYTKVVELKAYENDVLHALGESGGLPGVDSKNEIKILRGAASSPEMKQQYQQAMQDPQRRQQLFATGGNNIVKIPLRMGPKDPPVNISTDDIILGNGDIVFIESRSSEVFYTGGLLQGGQFPLPRDYDLDVLGAIAMSGGSIAAAAGGSATAGGGFSRGGVGSIFPPTRVIVVRTVGQQMYAIQISLKTAMTNPDERILIQPNDFVLLEYTEFELVANVLLNNVNLNLSLNDLFNR